MTTEEKEIMADMFYFLRDHSDPPAARTEACAVFWKTAARDIGILVSKKWNNNPLAMDIGIALYGYLEKKCKNKGGKCEARGGGST